MGYRIMPKFFLIAVVTICILFKHSSGALTSHIEEAHDQQQQQVDGQSEQESLAELLVPSKRGIDACSCCASKHLLFCCASCIRQGPSKKPPRYDAPHKDLAALRTKYCSCCREEPYYSVTEWKCCQRCMVLKTLFL